MFIAIVGSRLSGKSTIEEYLITTQNFVPIRLVQDEEEAQHISLPTIHENFESHFPARGGKPDISINTRHLSFLSISPLPSPCPTASTISSQSVTFSRVEDLLDFVTKDWTSNFVTTDLRTKELLEPFVRRPFFFILSCDAPIYDRFIRANRWNAITLDDFIREDDMLNFGSSSSKDSDSSLDSIDEYVNLRVKNKFPTISELYKYLDRLDFLDPEHLRPSWDSYFMTLASLASRRSNCMKRRVGAVIVRNNRIISTGYNGTARGVKNCSEGGCPVCNGTSASPRKDDCLCLHAEENALLEAGRDRIGTEAVLYCNTCPCLKCTIKIIQVGIKTVVYNLSYKVDDASARLFKEAGVELRRFDPTRRFRLSALEAEEVGSSISKPPKPETQRI